MKYESVGHLVQCEVDDGDRDCCEHRRRDSGVADRLGQRGESQSDDAEHHPYRARQVCGSRQRLPRKAEGHRDDGRCAGTDADGSQIGSVDMGHETPDLGAPYRRAGGEERVRLVARVGDQVQQGHLPQTQPALDQHEAHLGTGRPGEGHLHADACGHDQRCDHRRRHSHDDEQRPRRNRPVDDRREPEEHEAAEVDHAGVEERRDGRGRFHHLDQPTVERKLCGLQQGSHRNERDAYLSSQRQRRRAQRGCADLIDPQGVEGRPEAHRRGEHADIGAPRQEELLVRDSHRDRTIAEVGEKPVQGQTRRGPRGDEEREVVRHHDHRHSRERRQHQLGIASLMRVTSQVGAGEPHHHPAHERHQSEHDRRHRVESHDVVRVRTVDDECHTEPGRCGRRDEGGCSRPTPSGCRRRLAPGRRRCPRQHDRWREAQCEGPVRDDCGEHG